MKTAQIKKYFKPILLGLLLCSTCLDANSQTPPRLRLTKDSPTTAQINWTNQVGTSYRLWSTTSLSPSAWTPLEDAFSEDTNVVVSVSTTDTPTGFFRVQIPTNGTLPAVQIFSPTNSQTVSGEIAVGVGAQIGSQLQGVNLYLDDALVGYLNSGGMNFDLDTTHFANGQHTVYVGAVDTANNETLSSAITLDFENSVRWLDASSMFNYFVPIDVTADFFPADWLVTVTDTNGTIVRTITGSTTDGNIQTSWDGMDDNSQPLPVENLYQITVDVTETSGSSMMMSSSLASSLASTLKVTSVSSKLNPHGVPEFAVQKSAPNPLTAYLATLQIYSQLTPKEKLIYPPLLPRPANNPYAATTVMMSARDMFLAIHHTSSTTVSLAAGTATPNAGSVFRHGSTKDLVWWENYWTSLKTIVARVNIPGGFGNTLAQNCHSIATLIGEADGVVGNNRGVYDVDVKQVLTSSDVYGMTNWFVDPLATAFYFYGHDTLSGNSIGTQTAVIGAKTVGTVLGNYINSPVNGKPTLVTHKPFNFVFLDGCNTGLGDFPEAFGIPKHISGAALNEAGLHKRAFVGWGGPVAFQLDSSHLDWSLQFWTDWIDGGLGDRTVAHAINAAYQHDPSVFNSVPIKMYGNDSLKYSD